MNQAAWNAALNAMAIELYGRGEGPEAIYAGVMAEAERLASAAVLAEVLAKVAAIFNPALRTVMTKLLEKEIAHADQP